MCAVSGEHMRRNRAPKPNCCGFCVPAAQFSPTTVEKKPNTHRKSQTPYYPVPLLMSTLQLAMCRLGSGVADVVNKTQKVMSECVGVLLQTGRVLRNAPKRDTFPNGSACNPINCPGFAYFNTPQCLHVLAEAHHTLHGRGGTLFRDPCATRG